MWVTQNNLLSKEVVSEAIQPDLALFQSICLVNKEASWLDQISHATSFVSTELLYSKVNRSVGRWDQRRECGKCSNTFGRSTSVSVILSPSSSSLLSQREIKKRHWKVFQHSLATKLRVLIRYPIPVDILVIRTKLEGFSDNNRVDCLFQSSKLNRRYFLLTCQLAGFYKSSELNRRCFLIILCLVGSYILVMVEIS